MGAIMSRLTHGKRPAPHTSIPYLYYMIEDQPCTRNKASSSASAGGPKPDAPLCSICGRRPSRRICNHPCHHVFCYLCIDDYIEYEYQPKGVWRTRTKPLMRCPDAACGQPIIAVRYCPTVCE